MIFLTIDNKLVAVIENNKTKFKSFHNLRMVFDLSHFYQEATNDDLQEFSQHNSLEVGDINSFIEQADTQVRKMVHTISQTGMLDNYSVSNIQTAAQDFPNVSIVVENGKIKLPSDKKTLKKVLHFMLEDIYKGALSGSSYLANSKRSI